MTTTQHVEKYDNLYIKYEYGVIIFSLKSGSAVIYKIIIGIMIDRDRQQSKSSNFPVTAKHRILCRRTEWHCTTRIPSPLDDGKRSRRISSTPNVSDDPERTLDHWCGRNKRPEIYSCCLQTDWLSLKVRYSKTGLSPEINRRTNGLIKSQSPKWRTNRSLSETNSKWSSTI